MKSFLNKADINEIITRLATVQSNNPARWGRMNAHQMICHLSDAFRLALGEKAASPAGNILHRTLIKFVAIHVPAPWPRGFPTRPEMDQEIKGTPPYEFERDRQELEQLIARFVSITQDAHRPPHPIFGQMSHNEWMRWGWLHSDHHLRQFGA